MKLILPRKQDLTCIDPSEEPTRYYYWPLVGWFYRKRLEMMLDIIGDGPYESILEVAYGSGVFMPTLARLCRSLHGIDLHDKVDIVQKTLGKGNVRAQLVSGNALNMPYENERFDCVVCVSMLEHVVNPGDFIDEMLRILKSGGVLALGFPCRNPAMNIFFKMLGFNPRKIHPSSHKDILNALHSRPVTLVARAFPSVIPLDSALYCCCLVRKR